MLSSPFFIPSCRPGLTAALSHCISVASIIYCNVSAGGISNFSIFGMVQLPMSLAPFGALVITSVIIPQASFIGHLSGILMGYLMAYVLYGLTLNLWCSLALLALLTAGEHDRSNLSCCISQRLAALLFHAVVSHHPGDGLVVVVAVTSKYQRCWLHMRHICNETYLQCDASESAESPVHVCTCSMYRACWYI